MAYETPTPAQFKATHPAFAGVDDQVATDAITEAEGRVDETWREADRRPAVMLYAAHVLTTNGHGTGTEAQLAAEGLQGVQRLKSGTLDVTFAGSGGGDGSGLASTSYGRRFKELLRLNFAGPRVVPGRRRPCHPLAQDC